MSIPVSLTTACPAVKQTALPGLNRLSRLRVVRERPAVGCLPPLGASSPDASPG